MKKPHNKGSEMLLRALTPDLNKICPLTDVCISYLRSKRKKKKRRKGRRRNKKEERRKKKKKKKKKK